MKSEELKDILGKKKIDYVACDLDGTLLLGGAQKLPQEIFELIPILKEKNIAFIAASGRQYTNERRLFKEAADDIFYVAENGALVIHEGERLFSSYIDRDTAIGIFRMLRDAGEYSCYISCEMHCYVESDDMRMFKHLRDVVGYDVIAVDNIEEVSEPFLKLALCNFDSIDKIVPSLSRELEGKMRVVTSGTLWADVMNPGINKAVGLKALLRKLGIAPENGIAFGDQENDAEMLKLAGIGFAVESATAPAKKAADYVIANVPDVLKLL